MGICFANILTGGGSVTDLCESVTLTGGGSVTDLAIKLECYVCRQLTSLLLFEKKISLMFRICKEVTSQTAISVTDLAIKLECY